MSATPTPLKAVKNQIEERRSHSANLIQQALKDENQDWYTGLLIHVLGDAYAQTQYVYTADNE